MKKLLQGAAVLLLLLTLVTPQSTAFAQGTAFTYQGRLNDGASLATGSYDLTFSLFSVASGAGQVGGILTNASTAVSNGLFTVTLDFGANFPGANRWLEIGVRTNGGGAFTTLAPRQQLTATPYAITASNLTGNLPAAQLTGAIANGNLPASPAVSGTVTAGSFSGNGASVTNVNAASLNGLNSSNFWQLGGNNVSAGQFLGSTNNQPVELRVNNSRALRIDANTNGAPNVILGSAVNFVVNGVKGATISGGGAINYSSQSFSNSIRGDFGTVGGGSQNLAKDQFATVSGGFNNFADIYATVSGGLNNRATNAYATVGGGGGNFASGYLSTVAGGSANNAGAASAVGGGVGNYAEGDYATIAGGDQNNASGLHAAVGGGWGNYASGVAATVAGGQFNHASELYSFAAGQRANADHIGTFVWADSQDADFYSTGTNQFLIRASNGVGINTNNPQSALHVNGTATATAFSGSGASLTALNAGNLASGTVADARLSNNLARLNQNNTFTGSMVVTNNSQTPLQVLGNNTGGSWLNLGNSSSGGSTWNLISTGSGNGEGAGKLLVRDATQAAVLMTFSTNGNVGIGTSSPTNKLHVIGGVSATVFVTTSDRNAKEQFAPVFAQDVLAKVAALPITRWSFKEMPGQTHLGPMAQDFRAAFGLGQDATGIATVDADGVALAAIQGLNQKLEEQKAENAAMKKELSEIKRMLLNRSHQKE